MKPERVLAGFALVLLLGGAGFGAVAWRSEIAAVPTPSAGSFDAEAVLKGETLAAVGNCIVCHSKPGGEVFAGGLALPTPFGTIYSTNITPDPSTGIGTWSEAAFDRAMREGVDREGRHLYPAFPFDHFTKVTTDDNRALYAYLMTRKPVAAETPPNEMPFPFNIRMAMAGWKLLFLDKGPYENDPAHDAVWNRGAYLAEGLGHCGACHTPRNLLGAEKKSELFAGGEAEGWTAYALNQDSPAPIPWTVDSLTHYLTTGWEAQHGVSRGPMAPVTGNMASVPPEDVKAIATYVISVMGEPSEPKVAKARQVEAVPVAKATQIQSTGSQTVPLRASGNEAGAAIYAAACSTCHDSGRPLPFGGLPLRYSTAVYGPTPLNPINVILYGLPAPEGEAGPMMPGFAGALDDDQMAALLAYMRSSFSDRPAWTDVKATVAGIRAGHEDTEVKASDSTSSAPANPTRRETAW